MPVVGTWLYLYRVYFTAVPRNILVSYVVPIIRIFIIGSTLGVTSTVLVTCCWFYPISFSNICAKLCADMPWRACHGVILEDIVEFNGPVGCLGPCRWDPETPGSRPQKRKKTFFNSCVNTRHHRAKFGDGLINFRRYNRETVHERCFKFQIKFRLFCCVPEKAPQLLVQDREFRGNSYGMRIMTNQTRRRHVLTLPTIWSATFAPHFIFINRTPTFSSCSRGRISCPTCN